MEKERYKKYRDSEAVLAQMLLPYQANASGNIHGGEIMKLMDSTAGVSAMKYAHSNVVTARVDELQFKRPVHVGDHIICTAHVVYTGYSSMEVFVTVETENLLTGKINIALTAFFTMVAMNLLYRSFILKDSADMSRIDIKAKHGRRRIKHGR